MTTTGAPTHDQHDQHLPEDALTAAAARLAAAGLEQPAEEARLLAGHVAGLDLGGLDGNALDGNGLDGSGREAAYEQLVARRCAREPMQRLLGRVPFRRIELLVGPGVFVPQPETSSVVQWAVDALTASRAGAQPGAPVLCADLCTGSGTVGLCLAAEVPGSVVHLVETSAAALAWATRNAAHNGLAVGSQVVLHHGDAADALPGLDATLDLVASNPPYVATHEIGGVRPEVRDHDPLVALDAGPDGLDVIRDVERAARRLLRLGGLVVVEHSDRQGSSAPAVFSTAAWEDVQDHRDQDGLDRFVTARRRG